MDAQQKKWHLLGTFYLIKANPSMWDQRTWGRKSVCRTTACIAGHGVLLAGGDLIYNLTAQQSIIADDVVVSSLPEAIRREAMVIDHTFETSGNNGKAVNAVGIEYAAAALFGITSWQANDMFNSSNTMEDLEAMVMAIVNDAPWPNG
jgi:hypothetical protein